MKNSKKNFGIAGQSTPEVKKSQKHDANLQKNSSLYFQIGLILCLLGTYALFEMQFKEHKLSLAQSEPIDNVIKVDYVKPFAVEVKQPEKQESKNERSQEVLDDLKVVDDTREPIETALVTPEEKQPEFKSIGIDDIPVEPNDVDPMDLVPFERIEKVPVYPGCEKYTTNSDRMQCMSDKIAKLVGNKFNGNLAADYGLTGKQRISTQFTIDKTGNVIDIKIRAPHPALKREADRVINKIPRMEPGLQRNVPVGVVYTLPIVFQVNN
ncbi:energy transducer TonB [Winogradskyella ursingii]|uniref:energy transducer TonB n=1 Tax=Winogradskyella ursingii TaxID=2686079 RepID=UPI0015C8FCF2|nr:energy transducer TonB [Winogradskyella ursingii]